VSYAQAAILLCLGLQHKTVDKVVEELTLQPNQVLALFTKIIKKVHSACRALPRARAHHPKEPTDQPFLLTPALAVIRW
jgi:hypothetical protein